MDSISARRQDGGKVPASPMGGVATLRKRIDDLESKIESLIEENTQPDDQLWKVRDVAYFLNISKRTVENLIAEGEIVPLRVLSCRRFDPETIKTWARKQTRL